MTVGCDSTNSTQIENRLNAMPISPAPAADDVNVFLVPPLPILTIIDMARLGSALPPPRTAPSNSASTLKRNDGQPGNIPVAKRKRPDAHDL